MSELAGARIAIANRAEIAIRIASTCKRHGAVPILLLGEPDLSGCAARQVGRVERVGPAGSELDVQRVIQAAVRAGADYLHPGYGFLSERADLAEACESAGIRFVGPSAATLRLCGDKMATRTAAERVGVPVLAASPPLSDDQTSWLQEAAEVGYPLLVKPAGAGGGRGLRHVAAESALVDAILASRREAGSTGAGSQVYLEREMVEPRHVEVQVAGDGRRIVVVGDRDCSIQRRHQKVIEEAPAPNLDARARSALHDYARRIAEATDLRGIATCEFLIGGAGEIAFLEVNPRIQVEHPVTELVTGTDLVEWQLVIAAGATLPEVPLEPRGHAIEVRVYAEDPWAGFFPTPGRLATVSWPTGPDIRVDFGYQTGDMVPADYDSMLAKVIARGSDRASALGALRVALTETIISGVTTNLPWLLNLIDDEAVQIGRATTRTAVEVAPRMPDDSLVPVAASAHALSGPAEANADAWSAVGLWRMSGPATLTVHSDEWERHVTARQAPGGWEATVGESTEPIRWSHDAGGIWSIAGAGAVSKFAVIEREDELEVTGSGGRWHVRLGARPVTTAARHRRSSDGLVIAPLPATVLAIHVDAGDRVAAGQPLVTLYAMKMELVCDAPVAGIVERIECEVKQLVAADQPLVSVRALDAKAGDS